MAIAGWKQNLPGLENGSVQIGQPMKHRYVATVFCCLVLSLDVHVLASGQTQGGLMHTGETPPSSPIHSVPPVQLVLPGMVQQHVAQQPAVLPGMVQQHVAQQPAAQQPANGLTAAQRQDIVDRYNKYGVLSQLFLVFIMVFELIDLISLVVGTFYMADYLEGTRKPKDAARVYLALVLGFAVSSFIFWIIRFTVQLRMPTRQQFAIVYGNTRLPFSERYYLPTPVGFLVLISLIGMLGWSAYLNIQIYNATGRAWWKGYPETPSSAYRK